MKLNSVEKTLTIQLLSLIGIGILAYFVAVQNGLNLLSGKFSKSEFKFWVLIIILGAFIATGLIFLYAFRIAKENLSIRKALNADGVLIAKQNNDLKTLQRSINSLHQGVSIIGTNDLFEWVNSGFEEMFGFTKEECIGNLPSGLLAGPLTDRKQIEKIDNAVFKDKESINVEIIHYKKDKSTFWARLYISPIFDENGELVQYIAVSEDITSEIDARNKLAQSENNFRQIADTLKDTFYLYNIKDNKYEFISENSFELFGIHPKNFYEGVNNDLIVLHKDDREAYSKATELVNSGKKYTIEYRIFVNNEMKWVKESSFPITNDLGEIIQNSGACSDITTQKKALLEIKQKSKEISDSINYAKLIQSSTLPERSNINKIFKDFCLFYQPKDIVSGDFYDVSKINMNDGNELNSIVVADCTGHGVPGAVLAITCSTIIQSTFSNREINSPSEALEFCRNSIRNLFRYGENKIYDGMDVSWIVHNKKSNELYFSGAYNNCLIVRDSEVLVTLADKTHVAYSDHSLPFTNHVIPVNSGDLVFIASDGYNDQFGGPNHKKFGRKRFFELITSFTDAPLVDQNLLEKNFTNWKGDFEQTDDVCVFGFRI